MKKIKIFFKILKNTVIKSDMFNNSAQITYYWIFSIFPFLITLLNIFSFSNITNSVLIYNLKYYLPKDVFDFISNVIMNIEINSSKTLLFTSVIIGLFSSSKGVRSIIKSINSAYGINETRNFMTIWILSCFFTIGFVFLVVQSMILIVFARRLNFFIIKFFGIDRNFIEYLNFSRNIFNFLILFLIFNLIYRFSPDFKREDNVKFKEFFIGSIISTLLWLGTSKIFSFYIEFISKNNKIYGSLGGAIMLILWLSMISKIILFGAVLNKTIREFKSKIKTLK